MSLARFSKDLCFPVSMALLFGLPQIGFSQWISLQGPVYTTNVYGLSVIDSQILVSSECATFSKSISDTIWNRSTSISFKSAFEFKNEVYSFSKYDDDLYQLTLNGNHWSGSLQSASLSSITSYINEGDTLFLGSANKGLYYTVDAVNFTNVVNGLPKDSSYTPDGKYYYWNITSLAKCNKFLFATTDKGIYKTDESELNWVPLSFGSGFSFSFSKLFSINGVLYYAEGASLYRSTDLGSSFQLITNLGFGSILINQLIEENGSLYLSADSGGIYQSKDQGLTWYPLNAGLRDRSVSDIIFARESFYAATDSDGLYQFSDVEQAWKREPGVFCYHAISIASLENNLFVNGWNSTFRTPLSNINWQRIATSLPSVRRSIIEMDSLIILSTEYEYGNQILSNIYYSGDSGTTWSLFPETIPSGGDPDVLFNDGNTLYAYDNVNLSKTSDLGNHWTELYPQSIFNCFNSVYAKDNLILSAACSDGQLFRSLDGGLTWQLANKNIEQVEPYSFGFTSDKIFLGTFKGVYSSIDQGNTWDFANDGLPIHDTLVNSFASQGQTIFAATNYGVFASNDDGISWIKVNEGLDDVRAIALEIADSTLYVGTDGAGVWKRPLKDFTTSVSPPPNYTHEEAVAFPNPTIGKFVLRYPPSWNHVSMVVFDETGKEILNFSRLFEDEEFDLGYLPGGVYFLRLVSGNKTSTAKLFVQY